MKFIQQLLGSQTLLYLAYIALLCISCSPHYKENRQCKEYEHTKKANSLIREEKWEEVISYHQNLLQTESPNNCTRAEIYNVLATTYHYLGDYNNTIYFGELGAEFSTSTNQQIRSYYLISAAYRSKAQQKDTKPNNKEAALSWINKALRLANSPYIDDHWKSKVFFNAGALYHDVFHYKEKAKNYYIKAMKLCRKDSDSYNRILLRFIRILLESGYIDDAQKKINELKPLIKNETKTHVHLLQLEAKISIARKQFIESRNLLEKALILAKRKNMKGEIKRLNKLLSTQK